MLCHVTRLKIVDGKNISGSIDTNGFKPNFTWEINDFWLIFNRKFYLAFLNTALRSNLTVFPKTNTTVSMIFFPISTGTRATVILPYSDHFYT